jgi:arylsulfatase A-like enzyme
MESEPCSVMSDSTRRTYCGMVRSMDTNVESMMVELESAEFMSNTLIIFTGDNGGAPKNGGYNYPWRGSKGTLFDGGIKQVTWMWGAMLPEASRGTWSGSVFHHVDLLPTFLSLASSGHWKWTRTDYTLDGVDQWRVHQQAVTILTWGLLWRLVCGG